VQYGEETDLHAQMLGVAGNREQRGCYRAEQYLGTAFFVVESDGVTLLRHREYDVELLDRQ
jgi:hypothetical protein